MFARILAKFSQQMTNAGFYVSLLQEAKLVRDMSNRKNIFVELFWWNEIIVRARQEQMRAAAYKIFWIAQIELFSRKYSRIWKCLDDFRAPSIENLSKYQRVRYASKFCEDCVSRAKARLNASYCIWLV